ncbi:hypothetical protein PENSPDRAFT_682774 [Peniophora sp. CONT]|nr:hypothetical protein PENSPDRAFT_682774 [Peniophora sp. CONT]
MPEPAPAPAVQGYSLSDDQYPASDPTSVPLPKSPEVSAPQTQSFAPPGAGSTDYDGPNPFLGPGASAEAQDVPPSPGSRPGETVLSYTAPQQDYAPPPGPPPSHTIPPPTSNAVPPTSQPQTGGDEAIYASNTQLASLHAIFPDFDAETLQSVLESVGGDQDRAVDTLLGMSDPEHVSTAGPETHASSHPQQKSQTELDEEFARHLMLQEQEEYNQAQEARAGNAHGERWTPRSRSSQEQTRQAPPAGANANAGERDTFAEVQEQVSKIAESGKRTFSSFLTKAKAKLQEFDQPRTGSGSTSSGQPSTTTAPSNQQPPPAPWASGGSWNASQTQAQPTQNLDRHAQSAAYAPVPSLPTVPAPNTQANTVPGHDFAPSSGAGSGTPPPPRTGSGVSASPPRALNPSEVGLLPKRPVTLQTAQSGSVGGRGGVPPPDEGDELEYVENPFEEGRR